MVSGGREDAFRFSRHIIRNNGVEILGCMRDFTRGQQMLLMMLEFIIAPINIFVIPAMLGTTRSYLSYQYDRQTTVGGTADGAERRACV